MRHGGGGRRQSEESGRELSREHLEGTAPGERVDALWRLEVACQTLVDGVCEVHSKVMPAGKVVEKVNHHKDRITGLKLGSL